MAPMKFKRDASFPGLDFQKSGVKVWGQAKSGVTGKVGGHPKSGVRSCLLPRKLIAEAKVKT